MSDTCDVRVTINGLQVESRARYTSLQSDPKKSVRVLSADVTRGGIRLRTLIDDGTLLNVSLRDYGSGGHALATQIISALNRAMNPENNRLEEAQP